MWKLNEKLKYRQLWNIRFSLVLYDFLLKYSNTFWSVHLINPYQPIFSMEFYKDYKKFIRNIIVIKNEKKYSTTNKNNMPNFFLNIIKIYIYKNKIYKILTLHYFLLVLIEVNNIQLKF